LLVRETNYFFGASAGAVVVVVVVGAGATAGGVVVVVVLVAAVASVGAVVVVVLLLAGAAVGASEGFTSTLVVVVGAGVTSVLVQPAMPKATTAARIKGDFIVRVPSAGWLFDKRRELLRDGARLLMHCDGGSSRG
jgi:hypothetical protein